MALKYREIRHAASGESKPVAGALTLSVPSLNRRNVIMHKHSLAVILAIGLAMSGCKIPGSSDTTSGGGGSTTGGGGGGNTVTSKTVLSLWTVQPSHAWTINMTSGNLTGS